jgi:hypothetical protein
MELLKPDGFMIVQTPCFPVSRTYEEMVRNKDRFLEMLRPAEHLYIFSRQSLVRLFSELGAPFLYFEPAIFDHYDMFAVVSARELSPHTEQEGTEVLLRRPEGRIVQALLDANAQHKELVRRYEEIDADREARLQALRQARARIEEIEADREARLQKLLKMDALYKAMEERLASKSAADGSGAAR